MEEGRKIEKGRKEGKRKRIGKKEGNQKDSVKVHHVRTSLA